LRGYFRVFRQMMLTMASRATMSATAPTSDVMHFIG
jgi:hypothetical protein